MSSSSLSLSQTQRRALFIIPMTTAPISFISSALLIFTMMRDAASRRNNNSDGGGGSGSRPFSMIVKIIQSLGPRDQLLLGLSITDMIGSFGFSFSTLPGDIHNDLLAQSENYSQFVYGTKTTCNIQGFFEQIGTSTLLYNAAMGIFYTMTIRYNYSNDWLKKYYVPAVHVCIWSWMLSNATAILILDQFGFDGWLGCWFKTATVTDGRYPFILAIAHIHIAVLIILFSMIYLCYTVCQRESQNRRWDFASTIDEPPEQSTTANMRSKIRESINRRRSSLLLTSSNSSSRRSMVLTRRTVESGIMYSASALLCTIPMILLSTYPFPNGRQGPFYYCLSILNVTFMPLYGLFNVLIYTTSTWRPKLIQGISHFKMKISFACHACNTGCCCCCCDNEGCCDDEEQESTDIETSCNSNPPPQHQQDIIDIEKVALSQQKSKRKLSVTFSSSAFFKKGSRELDIAINEESKSTVLSETELSSQVEMEDGNDDEDAIVGDPESGVAS